MTFVFEAKRLPFDAVEDAATTAQLVAWVGEEATDTLTGWQRCLLTAVMPIVLQKPLNARPSHSDDGDNANSATPSAVESKNEHGELITHENARSPATRAPGTDDVGVALRILAGLDDLEAAYAHAVDVRRSLRHGAGDANGASTPVPLTAEEAIMAELLRERGGDDAVAGFFAVTRPLNDAVDDGGDEVDLAMCFDLFGNPIGIGAPVVFGGHGYHPI